MEKKYNEKAFKKKHKRSSILKKPPSSESSPTLTNPPVTLKRRISFSGKKSIKEFRLAENMLTDWGNSYEESEHKSSNSGDNLLLTTTTTQEPIIFIPEADKENIFEPSTIIQTSIEKNLTTKIVHQLTVPQNIRQHISVIQTKNDDSMDICVSPICTVQKLINDNKPLKNDTQHQSDDMDLSFMKTRPSINATNQNQRFSVTSDVSSLSDAAYCTLPPNLLENNIDLSQTYVMLYLKMRG